MKLADDADEEEDDEEEEDGGAEGSVRRPDTTTLIIITTTTTITIIITKKLHALKPATNLGGTTRNEQLAAAAAAAAALALRAPVFLPPLSFAIFVEYSCFTLRTISVQGIDPRLLNVSLSLFLSRVNSRMPKAAIFSLSNNSSRCTTVQYMGQYNTLNPTHSR